MGNILLADTGSSYVRTYRKLLAAKGWQFTFARSVKETIPYVRNKKADLIIIDSSVSAQFADSVLFKKHTASIPKIILQAHGTSTKVRSLWLKHNHVYPLQDELACNEINFWAKEVTRCARLDNENNALRSELRQKSTVSSLHAVMRNILSHESDAGKMLRAILITLKQVTGAGSASLLISDEPFFEMLKLRNSSVIRKQVFKKGTGIAGTVMEKRISLNIKNAAEDRRFDKRADGLGKVKVRSLLCVPMIINGRVVGVLRLVNKGEEEAFSEHDVELLKYGADYTAIVVERAYLYEKLKNDELTNLYNMNYIRHAIDLEIERSLRFDSVFSLIFMDMDNFKKINDRYGHLVGSRVIVEIAQILQKNVRKLDIVSRYGGDEFVILMPQTSREVSFLVAERLRKLIEKNEFIKNDSYRIRLTASFGVATYPYNANNKEDLLRLADNAMYSGKFLTKNMVYEAT